MDKALKKKKEWSDSKTHKLIKDFSKKLACIISVTYSDFTHTQTEAELWIASSINSIQRLTPELRDRVEGHELGSRYSHDLYVERLYFFKEQPHMDKAL